MQQISPLHFEIGILALATEGISHSGFSLNRIICDWCSSSAQRPFRRLTDYSTNAYLRLIRVSFSSMGSAANQRKNQEAAAWTQSMGKPLI